MRQVNPCAQRESGEHASPNLREPLAGTQKLPAPATGLQTVPGSHLTPLLGAHAPNMPPIMPVLQVFPALHSESLRQIQMLVLPPILRHVPPSAAQLPEQRRRQMVPEPARKQVKPEAHFLPLMQALPALPGVAPQD